MAPEQVAASYDQIAEQWLDLSTYGFAQIERAVAFVKNKGVALDVGCGAGRLMGLLHKHGFRTDGIDSSTAMIGLARDHHPEARLFHADICQWELPQSYDLIVARDSMWHCATGPAGAGAEEAVPGVVGGRCACLHDGRHGFALGEAGLVHGTADVPQRARHSQDPSSPR